MKKSSGFSKRLEEGLDSVSDIPRNRGRLAAVARHCGVSHTSANKWFHEEALPDSDNLKKLCDLLGVSADWLLYGEQESVRTTGKVPIFTTAELGKGKDFISFINERNWNNWVSVDFDSFEKLFAVKITDNFNAPPFYPNFTAFFDPTETPKNRDLVATVIEGNDGAVIRQYIHEGSQKLLISTSGQLAPIDITHKKVSFLGKCVRVLMDLD